MARRARTGAGPCECAAEHRPGRAALEGAGGAEEEVGEGYQKARATMTSPSAMRYHPKASKVWACTQRSSHLTTRKAVTADTSEPSATMLQSVGGSRAGCLSAL